LEIHNRKLKKQNLLISKLRKKYNSEFTEKRYSDFLKSLDSFTGSKAEFRIAETPIFLSAEFKNELINAGEDILKYITSAEFKKTSASAIPNGLEVPNEDEHTSVLAIDFAVCKDENGNLIPQLIELQGFPSLFCYQGLLNLKYREHFDIPSGLTNFFNDLNHDSYISTLKDLIVDDEDPENVILLEIEPEKQKTNIDFFCTEKWLGVKPVCITDVIKEGRKLFYMKDGRKIPVRRIYNRVIFDELLKRSDLKLGFNFQDSLDVKWIPHPNWFFRISKHTLPLLKSKYVPQTFFLNELDIIPDDLERYVLKPLFSFAGSGVKYDVTKADIDSIKNRHNYILQHKINYEPVIETPDIPAKAEIRLLYVWKDSPDAKPLLVNNIVRLSKGKMMGVDFNKDKTWVGSSIAYFEE
jgi:hypothetical protein